MIQFNKNSSIFIAGARGMVGSAMVRILKSSGYSNLLVPSHKELDLTRQVSVAEYFKEHRPEVVVLAAARVGGILANKTFPADFLYENLAIGANVIESAYRFDVKKLLYLGSSCIYPRLCPQPMKEEDLLSGPLEPTNEGYALAKIASLKLCEKYYEQYHRLFVSAMPCNLYGVGDNFHPDHSHVIPGLMRRIHEAKVQGQPEVTVWGSGLVRREFLFIEDLAEALLLMLENYEESMFLNVGYGTDVTIRELAETIQNVVGYQGQLKFDTTKPDGPPKKLLDITRISKLGWRPKTNLEEGLTLTYQWALQNHALEAR